MAELADARDLKSLDTLCRTGSSPVSGTRKKHLQKQVLFLTARKINKKLYTKLDT